MKTATLQQSPPNTPPASEHRSWAKEPVLSHAELAAAGKALREKCPRKGLAEWKAADNRADPIQLLIDSSQGRVEHLLPIRYGRMMQAPFTFYRGAAALMAADLAPIPTTGVRVQVCGDCHLLNFGGFATPERRLIFDINDFDETLPGPWEWDLERLATSFFIACRNNGFSDTVARDTVLACAFSYKEKMAEFAQMTALDIWYARIDVEKLLPQIEDQAARKRIQRQIEKTQAHKLAEDIPKMVETIGDQQLIKEHPPLIYHWPGLDRPEVERKTVEAFRRYRNSLQEDRRALLDRYRLRDIAVKVVGVGSVGTRCGVMLLMGSDGDALFLQIKEACSSVLEPYAGKCTHSHHGQRVVTGQRLMQSASDVFLGWTEMDDRHYYLRQLRDMKIKPMVEIFSPSLMEQYAEICAWTLARAHARSGEAAMISGYLGKSDVFDRALVSFARTYADLTEQDHAALLAAVKKGRIKAVEEPKPG
jgi:uncharacterized protein (DUF2252 family)